jgi:hypothetical protein
VLLLHIVLLLQSLDDLEGEIKSKRCGSTRTNTNYHLLEVLVFWMVLVQTNTKITPTHGCFVLVCPKLTLTHGSIHGHWNTLVTFTVKINVGSDLILMSVLHFKSLLL